MDINCR